ncbi:hypothetical protein ACHAWF_006710 [Thalassiosira exigua]
MSRRRGEFEHRTSIFEGAFRAWSHLGGLDPSDLEGKTATELDPFVRPLENDPRLAAQKEKKGRPGAAAAVAAQAAAEGEADPAAAGADAAGKNRREYPYEPLPRSGLAHPFVQAILSPWLGPDADQDAIQLGLTTLRTWWQHRRKGESGSAIVALGTEKMKGVVEGYTRHFFNLAHCLVVNDGEQPPRSLQAKMRDLEKVRNKKGKKRTREEDEAVKATAMAFQSGFGPAGGAQLNQPGLMGMPGGMAGGMGAGGAPGGMNQPDLMNLGPLERLQAAQGRLLAESGGVTTHGGPGGMGGMPGAGGMGGGGMNGQMGGRPSLPQDSNGAPNAPPSLNMRGQCVPGRIDLPGIVQQVSSAAAQLGMSVPSMGGNKLQRGPGGGGSDPAKYGDPNETPVVVVSPNLEGGNGSAHKPDVQFCMTIDGITCFHCVKIVETVLRGCRPASRSPIDGLLDAAADMDLNMVLIKVEDAGECRRIAHEAARNLSMVGYTARAKSVRVPSGMDLSMTVAAMEGTIPRLSPMRGFDWTRECACPDNNVLRQDCPRWVVYGTCLMHISCTFFANQIVFNISTPLRHSQFASNVLEPYEKTEHLLTNFAAGCTRKTGMPCTAGVHCFCKMTGGDANGSAPAPSAGSEGLRQRSASDDSLKDLNPEAFAAYQQPIQDAGGDGGGEGNAGMPQRGGGRSRPSMRMSLGRMSIGGLGGLGRHMSLTSETTFGRAMSGLSALSIDWENMEDFDVNVDHSAGINNDIIKKQQAQQQQQQRAGNGQQQRGNGSGNGEVDAGQQPQGQDNGAGGYNQPHPGMEGGGPRFSRRSSLRKNLPPGGAGNAFNVSFNM